VNGYRVEEAKRRLAASKHRQLSLEALGMDCGFSSKTTFNRVFRKMEGCTPGEFRGLFSNIQSFPPNV
jgi:AraC-like DNA-binding protein